MPKIFSHKFTVTEDAIDDNGHVNNVTYVQWMQDIAIMHSDVQGYDATKYNVLDTTWVVRSHNIEYSQPAFAGDEIEILTWVSNIKGTRSLRKTKFVRTKDQAILAKAETNWVYIRRSSGRPCLIDDFVRQAFIIVPENEEP